MTSYKYYKMINFKNYILIKKGLLLVMVFSIAIVHAQKKEVKQPNILFCIADDASYLHSSIQGTSQINTPNFDRVAKKRSVIQ
ncbi:hypothetical protein FFWV33_15145 [Flavobacterium faecale]|uniref:Sulfatase N-terminal domain-containing protein n=1 Tax=Flavobacterium faecale TaxID=1355330 RepID=A0A2S1LGA6_9FLAO|nr:hypothetical protein FFWV33_15145 [Flavobacterium faecale]